MTKELREDQDSYKVVDSSMLDKKGNSFQGGRYIGTSPMKAAKKAAKKLFALPHDKDDFSHHKHLEHIVFKLSQTTRGSDHKEYVYKAKKLKAKTELTTIKVGDRSIQVRKGPVVEVSPAEEGDLLRAVQEVKSRMK